jgi:cell division protein FtsI (penicillin-binding protein 3)
MNAPRYAIYVMVDEPKPNARSHGYATAGWVAAPAAGMVIRNVAPILGMAPEVERRRGDPAGLAMPMQPAGPARPRGPRPRRRRRRRAAPRPGRLPRARARRPGALGQRSTLPCTPTRSGSEPWPR